VIPLPWWYGAAVKVAFAVEIAGGAIGLYRWPRLSRAQRLMTLWLVASALVDLLIETTSARTRNAQPLAHVWYAASVIFGVGAMAALQSDRRLVRIHQGIVVAFLAIWGGLAATVEPITEYSKYSAPLHAVVILGAALAALFRRVVTARDDLLLDSGFLLSVGLIAYAVPSAFQTLVAQLWLREHPANTMAY
jgi:hypothetical protein